MVSLEHKLKMLGSATWTHSQLHRIGDECLAHLDIVRRFLSGLECLQSHSGNGYVELKIEDDNLAWVCIERIPAEADVIDLKKIGWDHGEVCTEWFFRFAPICQSCGGTGGSLIAGIHNGEEFREWKQCPDCAPQIVPWASYMEIVPHSENKIWVRWTGIDGIYRWLHPDTRTWVEEPHQINMPMFRDYATARKAADESPEPPTWAEYAAKTEGGA